MSARPVLVTGFVPYAGRSRNPAAEVAAALDGKVSGGAPVVGRQLPVSLERLAGLAAGLLAELRPAAVISLGLAPGTSVIRLERVALNLADFESPDNDGRLVRDRPLVDGGPAALLATLPIRAIESALLAAAIPARISNSAGTYLCNACLYHFLNACPGISQSPLCGFIHVPYLPAQVAELRRCCEPGEVASMELETTARAVEIAIETTLLRLS